MKTILASKNDIDAAADLLKQGELVAFPTETVYGLGAVSTDVDAVKKIFIAKGRPSDNPLIVHVADMDGVRSVASVVDDRAELLFSRFSPGPLTLILPKRPEVPYEVTAGLETVGVRIPDHPVTLELLKKVGIGVAAPSANTSSRVSPSRAMDVLEDMDGKIPMIIDGGNCRVGIESTVLDLTKEVPVILRPGAITEEMLLEVLPEVKTFKGEIKVAEAPGMKYKHYAPTVPCYLVKSTAAAHDFIAAHPDSEVAVLARTKFFEEFGKGVDLGADLIEFERNIYSALRDSEKNFDVILIEYPEEQGVGKSILNRIIKSSAGKIIGD